MINYMNAKEGEELIDHSCISEEANLMQLIFQEGIFQKKKIDFAMTLLRKDYKFRNNLKLI